MSKKPVRSDQPVRYDGPMKEIQCDIMGDEKANGGYTTEVPDEEEYAKIENAFKDFLPDKPGKKPENPYWIAFLAGWAWGKEGRQVYLADHEGE